MMQLDECRELAGSESEHIFLNSFENSVKQSEALSFEILNFENPIGNSDGMVKMELMDEISDHAICEIDKIIDAETVEIQNYLYTTQLANLKSNRSIIIVGLIITFCLLVGSYFYVKEITRPIKHLLQTTQKVIAGDLSAKAEVNTGDEIENFALSFNDMIEVLEKTTVSRDYFDNILNRMVDSLIITSAEGQIKIVNPATLELLGYKEEEIIGQSIYRIISEPGINNTDILNDPLKLISKNGNLQNIHYTYYGEDSKPIPVLFSGSHLYNSQNQITGLIFVAFHNTKKCTGKEQSNQDEKKSNVKYIKTLGEIPLTSRELEITSLIAQEKSNREISEKLFISVRTVETHRRNIMQKLEVKSVISLVHYAVQNKLI
jgi:PAS domain S-box-containing protein